VDAWGRPEDQGATVQMGSWSYAGLGYRTAADAWLAWSMRQDARERRRIAREELSTVA